MANEKRLIDANALISNLRTCDGMGAIVAESLVRFVKKQPTVVANDVVPVVRCKDCKNYHTNVCPLRAWEYTEPDDFCSYGERKDND
jgi:threonine dehydrogenase-like Zn-dependent dehydrogenase